MQVAGTARPPVRKTRPGLAISRLQASMAFEGFSAINTLAMRDFGLLESGREDNKREIPDCDFHYAVAR
jgi:hypothetical protein